MRLLFLTNFYPPASLGGYELWCQEVAAYLASSGHDLLVLTSQSRTSSDDCRGRVRVARELHLEMEIDSPRNVPVFFLGRKRRSRANLECARRWMRTFEPQFVVIWGMWNLDRSLAALAEELYGARTVYYFGDYWPSLPSQWQNFWRSPARSQPSRVGKWLLKGPAERLLERDRRPALSFPHALFPSNFMRERYESAGIPLGRAKVVLGGVATEAYSREAALSGAALGSCSQTDATPGGPLRLLVTARLAPEKGVHTVLDAVALLAERGRGEQSFLTVVGKGEEAYEHALRERARRLGVDDHVRFLGVQRSEVMPRTYCQHDVVVFPSTWDEPFGRVLVEAMAAGIPVVGTNVGGAAEILRDGETGLVFAPGDAAGLADQIERLIDSPDLRKRLARQGQAWALDRFDVGRMAKEIEAYLVDISTQGPPNTTDSVR
jgi:glycosyltransferase involved in cell wall biosynthesis